MLNKNKSHTQKTHTHILYFLLQKKLASKYYKNEISFDSNVMN